jgi:hypothetical protein
MGDFHFVVRHTLTGFVLIAFFISGAWMFHPESTEQLAWFALRNATGMQPLLAIAGAVLFTSPVLGVSLQAVYVFFLYASGRAFSDTAREELAGTLRERITQNEVPEILDSDRQKAAAELVLLRSDAIFVWLYHSEATPHLIEWARRRRSYHYLGVNWAVAAVLGLMVATVYPVFFDVQLTHAPVAPGSSPVTPSREALLVVLSFTASLWITGSLWLAIRMREDADAMERTWVFAWLHPTLTPSLRHAHKSPVYCSPEARATWALPREKPRYR